jgi:vitamin B12 transporter
MKRPALVLALLLAIVVTIAPSGHADPSPAAAPTASASPGSGKPPAAMPSPGKEARLKTMVVTATRVEQPIDQIGTTVTVVPDHQMQSQKIQDVGTALQQVPGVNVTQAGSPGTESDVSIRGASASQSLILIDGVEVNGATTGAFNIANLTTDNLNRIEVLRGAGGSLYGSQAIGGVVNLLSQEGEGAPTATMLSEGGNSATSRQIATLSGADGKLGFSGAVDYFSTEGFHLINDNSDNLSLQGRLDYHLTDDTTIRGFGRYIMSNVSLTNFTIPFGVPNNPTAHQRGEFMLYKGEVEHKFGEKLVVRTNGYYVRNQIRVNEVPFSGFDFTEVDNIPEENRGFQAQAVYTWNKNFRTVSGFDFRSLWARSDSYSLAFGFPFTSSFSASQEQYAGYLEQEATLLDGHVIATGGFRVDGNSQFGREVSPSWSVVVPVEKLATSLRGSYAEGFRAPSFDELYFPGFGNPNLQPEISSEYDGGFTTSFGELATLTATYFSRRIHNLVVSVPCTPGPGCPFGALAGNAGRVDTQGVEIVPMVNVYKGLTAGGSVTYLDETHASGATPTRVPKWSAQTLVQYIGHGFFLPHDQVIGSLASTFVGSRDDITSSGTILDHQAYWRFDLVASYALGRRWNWLRDEQVFTRVSNLLDARYSEAFGFRSPPINFVAGVKVDLQ